jgi:tRNA(adenine34) deaminase
MDLALRLARKAEDRTYPNPMVGCVIVKNGRVIGQGYHKKAGRAHAEVEAIRSSKTSTRQGVMYVSLEPCTMCAGAIVLSRVQRVVYAAQDPKAGMCGSLGNLVQDERLNHRVELVSGVRADEASALLKTFFAERR